MQAIKVLTLISLSVAGIEFANGESSLVCEHSALTLRCDDDKVLHIQSASYGRNTGGSVCPSHTLTVTSGCHATSSLGVLRNACEGKDSCSVSASNSVFGDPCVGTYKYLAVSFECHSTSQLERACEHDTLELSCPSDHVISVSSSSYGRNTGMEVCPASSLPVTCGCHADTSLKVVRKACEGQNSCSVSASNGVFGDPCAGTFKYLEVQYKCRPSRNTDIVCEHQTLNLACPEGKEISIISADYGRNAGSEVCSGANGNDVTRGCSSSSSYNVVREACQGKNTCGVGASNSVFGDPCFGTFKYLQTTYECVEAE